MFKTLKLKCKVAGKHVKTLDGLPVICEHCEGIIIVQIANDRVVGKRLKSKMFGRVPRIPYAMFNCPATILDPRKSELVEVIE